MRNSCGKKITTTLGWMLPQTSNRTPGLYTEKQQNAQSAFFSGGQDLGLGKTLEVWFFGAKGTQGGKEREDLGWVPSKEKGTLLWGRGPGECVAREKKRDHDGPRRGKPKHKKNCREGGKKREG